MLVGDAGEGSDGVRFRTENAAMGIPMVSHTSFRRTYLP